VKDVFAEIEKNSGYVVLYHDANVDVTRKVSIHATNQPIERVLDELFQGTDNIYTISDRQIFISKSTKSATLTSNAKVNEVQQAPQQYTITGVVKDRDGETLVGVAVRPKSKSPAGVMTGLEGEFTIYVKSMDETLVFTYVGMKTKEVKLKEGTTNYQVVMESSDNELGTVVVDAGIIQRDKTGFTGSYKTVSHEELESVGNMNVLQSLKSIDPAFVITDNNMMGSDPNTLANISVRGGSTMNITSILDDTSVNPNEPLFILDGFETTLQVVNDLDINRIESITILKDAGSTAIYGSKGGNGVIVIETIKPKQGKVMVSYGGDFEFASADLSAYNMMNASEKLEYELKAGRYNDINNWWGNEKGINEYYRRKANVERGVDTYWLKIPIKTSLTQYHSLTISGGNDDFLYQVGANYRDVEGVMKGSSRESFGGNMRLT
jgi:TonB-dependent SusC/RagA subfamily outer membrane receptor